MFLKRGKRWTDGGWGPANEGEGGSQKKPRLRWWGGWGRHGALWWGGHAGAARLLSITGVMTEVKGHSGTVRVSAPSLHDALASAKRPPQRSPFAIQELLGLGPTSSDDGHHHHNHHSHHQAALHSQAMFGARMAYFNAQAAVAAAQAFLPQPQPALHHPSGPPPGMYHQNLCKFNFYL